jgi:hypothetical protein
VVHEAHCNRLTQVGTAVSVCYASRGFVRCVGFLPASQLLGTAANFEPFELGAQLP